jgi:YD repeat-containing protein
MHQCAFTRLLDVSKIVDGRYDSLVLRLIIQSTIGTALLSYNLVAKAQEGVSYITTQTDQVILWRGNWDLRKLYQSAQAAASEYVAYANQGHASANDGCSMSLGSLTPNFANTINGTPFAIDIELVTTCTRSGQTSSSSSYVYAEAVNQCPIDSETGSPMGAVTLQGSPNFKVICQKRSYLPQQPPPNVCPKPEKGNPIGLATGQKLERQRDYQTANGLLTFERTSTSASASPSGANSNNHYASLIDLHPQPTGLNCYMAEYQIPDAIASQLTGKNVYQYRSYCFAYYYPPTPPFTGVYVYIGNTQRLAFSGDSTANALQSLDKLGSLITTGTPSNLTYTFKRRSFNGIEIFDSTGKLTQRVLFDGKRLSYAYVSNTQAGAPLNVLHSITDTFGRVLALSYRPDNQISSFVDPAGQTVSYGYGETTANCLSPGNCARLTSVSYPDGSKKTYYYDEPAYLSSETRTLGRLTGIGDENGNRYATFAYDASGRAISTEHVGSIDKYTVTYINDVYGNISSSTITDPLGSISTMGFTPNAMTSYVASQSQPAGSGCAASSSAIAYDANANPISRDNFTGQRTCYAYDLTRNLETVRAEGLSNAVACPTNLSTYIPPASTATSAIRKVTTQWHPDWRMETRRAEPKLITTFVYNGQPDPTAANVIASCAPTTALLPDGKPIAVLCKKVEQATTDETGGAGFSAVSLAAASGGTPRVWAYTYNAFGQVLTAKGPRSDVNETTTNTYYATTTVDYTMGDLATMTNAAGHVTNYTKYDPHGNVLRKVEPNGVTTDYTYDLRQRLKTVTVTPAGGATAAVPAQVTKYDYDPVGQMIKATQPDGSFITYTYDPAHRLTDITDSLGNTMHYTLDNMGNRVKEETKDAGGALKRNIARVYDALNRLQNVTGSVQ